MLFVFRILQNAYDTMQIFIVYCVLGRVTKNHVINACINIDHSSMFMVMVPHLNWLVSLDEKSLLDTDMATQHILIDLLFKHNNYPCIEY